MDVDTDVSLILDLLLEHWNLPLPKLLISVTGGAQRFEMKPKLLDKFKFGLLNAATSTGGFVKKIPCSTLMLSIVNILWSIDHDFESFLDIMINIKVFHYLC